MNTSKQSTLTIIAAIGAVVIPYLLTQSDVVIPAVLKVVLTAGNLALVVWSRLSNPNAEPAQVQITSPVEVTPAPNPTEPQP
jgi:hypothetical protein